MLQYKDAVKIVDDWITAWNSHNIDLIMEHYADNIDFTSPFIIKINNDPSGRISGKSDLRAYFLKGFQAYPDLHFELYHVITGVNSLVILYKSVNNLLAAESMIIDSHLKITKVLAHYKEQ